MQGQLAPVLDMIMYTLLCGKILLGTRYTWRELICAGVLYFCGAVGIFQRAEHLVFGPCDGAVGSQSCAAAAQFAGVFRLRRAHAGAGGSAAFAGIIAPDALSERSGSYRLMFGYGHPNTFGGIVLGLVLAWVLLRQAKITWAEIAAVAGVGLFYTRARRLGLLRCARFAGSAAGLRQTGGRAQRAQAHRRAVRRHEVPVVGAISYILPLFVVKNWSLG